MNLISIVLILIQALFITRFHLEISNVNGFLEPVNTIRKITNPLVIPAKRFIPLGDMKKLAAIVVALIISILFVWFFNQSGLLSAILVASIIFISTWISFLQYGMFLFVIGSWIQIPAFQRTNYILYNVFSPMLRPIQKIIPSVGGLDFSSVVFLLALIFCDNMFTSFISSL